MRTPILALLLAATAATAQAEETVTIPTPGGDVVGTLALPDGDPAPVVLLLHGFTGARDELPTEHVPEGVFARTAARLKDAGYASLRIDFRGSGESLADLTFADTTFEGQISDGLAALDYLSSLDSVAGDDIFVIGWSQGGLVAGGVAGRSNTPDAVALWNAVADPVATYGGLLGMDLVKSAAAGAPDDVHAITLPWGAEIELKGAFFQGVDGFDPASEITGYDGPLFVARGSGDTTVLPETATQWIDAHDGPEELWTAEMDHVFNVFGEADALDTLTAATIGYFDAHQD